MADRRRPANPHLLVPDWKRFLSPGWVLRAWLATRGSILSPLGPDGQPDLAAIRATRAQVPLLMNDAAALQIMLCVRAARRLGGAMAEAGVLMGGSARLICEAKGDLPLHLFDVFETLQSADAAMPGADADAVLRHFGDVHGDGAKVAALLAPYPAVHLHPGVFPESAAEVAGTHFCFVHLDLDLPHSTHQAIAFFHPRLLPGGILIGDDYEDPDVRNIFRTFFASRDDMVIELPWGQVMIVKRQPDHFAATVSTPRMVE